MATVREVPVNGSRTGGATGSGPAFIIINKIQKCKRIFGDSNYLVIQQMAGSRDLDRWF